MRKKPNFDEIWSESLISLSFITSSKFTEGKWPNGTDQITSINETKGIYSLALIPRKPKAYIFFIAATSIVVALILLLLLSINRSQVIRHQWNNLSADFIKLSKTGNAVDDPAHFSRLANYDLIAFRIVDNRLIANTAIHLFDPDDADHQLYQFIETTDPVPYLFLHQNTGFLQFAATMKMFVADHHAPIELIGVIDNQIIGFTISQAMIYHNTLRHGPAIIIISLIVSLPASLLVLWLYLRFQRRPLRELLKILKLISDDPTIIQPIPKSLESFGELQTVAQAIETLQRNMVRELTQRERLADIFGHPSLNSLNDVIALTTAGDHHKRHTFITLISTHPLEHFNARNFRHFPITEHQVDIGAVHNANRFASVNRLMNTGSRIRIPHRFFH